MANRHIKVINGRKYYYQSIRKGKKVTSKYLGPVEEIDAKEKEEQEIESYAAKRKKIKEEDLILPDDSYIG